MLHCNNYIPCEHSHRIGTENYEERIHVVLFPLEKFILKMDPRVRRTWDLESWRRCKLDKFFSIFWFFFPTSLIEQPEIDCLRPFLGNWLWGLVIPSFLTRSLFWYKLCSALIYGLRHMFQVSPVSLLPHQQANWTFLISMFPCIAQNRNQLLSGL